MRGLLLVTLLALSGCCPSAAARGDSSHEGSAAKAAAADPVVEKARAVVALAREVEPAVTPLLRSLAEAEGGKLVKLDHRVKTLASTERKIHKEMAEGATLDHIRIEDALRYTMLVEDVPPGRYVQAVRSTLGALEEHGHAVEYAKNYWPADDNYSGINTVLRDRSGLFWELQFHTAQSFAAQDDTRAAYEELRNVRTPLERKRELFDVMTRRWNAVPVPAGVLEGGALHRRAQIRDRRRP